MRCAPGFGAILQRMRDFQKIIAWQKAHALGVRLDDFVDPVRFRKRPALRAQLLRAMDSVSAAISEGAGKPSRAEFLRYLDIALGSAREAHNHLLKARDIRCMDFKDAQRLIDELDEVKRLIYAYARAIREAPPD